jgi:hypothetical protein
LVAGCVDLAKPWDQVASTGGAAGTGANASSDDAQGPVASGGVFGGDADSSRESGLGGSDGQYDAARDSVIDFVQAGVAGMDAGMDRPLPGTGGDDAKGQPAIDAALTAPDGFAEARDMSGGGGGMDGGLGTGGLIGRDASGAGGAAGTGGQGGIGGTTVPPGVGGATVDGSADPIGGATSDGGIDASPDGNTLSNGLLAYYPCESATGSTLPDLSGQGHDATLSATGSYSFPSGKIGRALSLNKANSGYVSMPPAMFRGRSQITIAAWVKVVTAENWQRFVDIGVNANLQSNPLDVTNSIAYMNFVPQDYTGTMAALAITNTGCVNEQRLSTSALSAGSWRHVAIVLSGSSGALYIDAGTPVVSSAMTLRPADLGTIDYAYIGRSQFGVDPYFDGMIDELRIYDRALSADEVQLLYGLTGP